MSRIMLLIVLLGLAARVGSGAKAQAAHVPSTETPAAQDLVAAADRIRNPKQPFRLTDTLVEYRDGKPRDRVVLIVFAREEKDTRQYSNLVRYADPPRDAGKMVLLHGSNMWFYDPASKASVRISPHQRLIGQASDGDVVTAADCELRVIGTPGHSADSLSLLLSQDAALLTGDTVLGRGTTVIAHGGSLADYLRSLDAMKALADTASVRVLLPGHGPVVSDPGSTLAYYIEHRAERLAEVRAALAAGDTTAQQIVARVYHDVDPAVRRFAELSVQAQLDYLAAAG